MSASNNDFGCHLTWCSFHHFSGCHSLTKHVTLL
uniref:Uncharacterized protein n=1 Tax=Arundo donax TaxID=35708 RepID=A0A0A8XWR0_ARUDO